MRNVTQDMTHPRAARAVKEETRVSLYPTIRCCHTARAKCRGRCYHGRNYCRRKASPRREHRLVPDHPRQCVERTGCDSSQSCGPMRPGPRAAQAIRRPRLSLALGGCTIEFVPHGARREPYAPRVCALSPRRAPIFAFSRSGGAEVCVGSLSESPGRVHSRIVCVYVPLCSPADQRPLGWTAVSQLTC